MCLIKDYDVGIGKHATVGGFPNGGGRQKQMVIDDDHLRLARLLPRFIDKTLGRMRAFFRRTVFPTARHIRPNHGIFGHSLDAGPVPGQIDGCKAFDDP